MQHVPERRVAQLPVVDGSCAGFTYIGVLFVVALMGAMLVAVATIWHQAQQREKEKQLLFIGKQFRQAIASYYENSPGGLAKQFPKSLDDLLEDRRLPFTRRHLRKIFFDPFTNSTEWGLVKDAGGGITGVYSKSGDEPVKQANFGQIFAQFEGKKHYFDWQFVYVTGAVTIAQIGSEVPALPPGETIPPEYVAPPPKPPTSDSPDDRKKHLCDLMHSNDLRTCFKLSKQFGDAAGTTCLASAASRYSACLNGETLPALAVQYK
jgi:type II secretory pathway pseudopilin PulG